MTDRDVRTGTSGMSLSRTVLAPGFPQVCPGFHHRGHRDHRDGSQSWEPWEGSHTLPRWCAAGGAGGLPTRGRKGSDPDLEPFLSGLCTTNVELLRKPRRFSRNIRTSLRFLVAAVRLLCVLCGLCGETPDRAVGGQIPRESWLAPMSPGASPGGSEEKKVPVLESWPGTDA
jgi:hypothetical protein